MPSAEAAELNAILQQDTPAVYDLLSAAGKAAFFPKTGILGQTAEARGARINATIGQALEDNGSPMTLPAVTDQLRLPPEQSVLYSPSHGRLELRERWRTHLLHGNPSLQAPISLPVVTGGITHGLYLAGQLFVNRGDQIIIPDTFWGNYTLIYDHARFAMFPLFDDNGFNTRGLRRKVLGRGRRKIVLLNFPHNPTGYAPTGQEAEEIAQALRDAAESGKSIVAICDDAYSGLIFADNASKESLFARLAGLHERILAIRADGITKEAYGWGLRVGFLTYGCKGMTPAAAAALEDKTAGMVRKTISNACTHSQFLAANALASPDYRSQSAENYRKLRERYTAVTETLRSKPQYAEFFRAMPFNAGYFMCIELKKNDAQAVRRRLLTTFGTGVIAMGSLLRIAYSSVPVSQIPQLFENIYQACREASQ